MKNTLKRAGRHVIAKVGRQRWTPSEPTLVLLMYHRVLPPNDPEMAVMQPGMVVGTDTFAMHLKVLKDLFEIVALDDWAARVSSGAPVPLKACAICLDDGWRDTHDHAFPLLEAAQAPAIVFLASAMIGTPQSFWPERLARVALATGGAVPQALKATPEGEWLTGLGLTRNGGGPAPDRLRLDQWIERAKGGDEAAVLDHLARIEAQVGGAVPPVPDLLDWDQVRRMAASGLIQFGSHTRHHVRMTDAVGPEVAENEIVESRREIEAAAGCAASVFCYPNGDRTPRAERLVRAHYAGACTTEVGWNTARRGTYALRRIGVHEGAAATETAFLARLSAWM